MTPLPPRSSSVPPAAIEKVLDGFTPDPPGLVQAPLWRPDTEVSPKTWNQTGKWLWSDKIVPPPIIERETFDQVQAIVASRAHAPAPHKPHHSRHPYALRGCVWCAVCERRMQSHWAHDVPYYRCRFPAEYALANRVRHPLNVYLREDQLTDEVSRWLAREFAPHRLHKTITALANAQLAEPLPRPDEHEETTLKIAECDRKLAQYRAALDAGASPANSCRMDRRDRSEKSRIPGH